MNNSKQNIFLFDKICEIDFDVANISFHSVYDLLVALVSNVCFYLAFRKIYFLIYFV